MKIDAINTSITQMNPRQSYEFILELRKRRRLVPVNASTKHKKKAPAKKPVNISALLNSLTPEQASKILEALNEQ